MGCHILWFGCYGYNCCRYRCMYNLNQFVGSIKIFIGKNIMLSSSMLRSSIQSSIHLWRGKRIFRIENGRVFGSWKEKFTTNSMDDDFHKYTSTDANFFSSKLTSMCSTFKLVSHKWLKLSELDHCKLLYLEHWPIEIFKRCATYSHRKKFNLFNGPTYCNDICINFYWFYGRLDACKL